MAVHVLPTLAPALAAPQLLGLLARPTSCASDGDGICASCNAGSPCMAVHVRPTLAPALVAPRLLGLLARPTAMVCASCDAGFTLNGNACQANACARTGGAAAAGASRTSVCEVFVRVATGFTLKAVNARLTLAPALVAPRLLGLLARPMAMAFAQVATQAHPVWQCMSGQRLRLHWWLRGYWVFLRIRWRWHLRELQRRLTL